MAFGQQNDNTLDDIYQQKQFAAQETRVSEGKEWEPSSNVEIH